MQREKRGLQPIMRSRQETGLAFPMVKKCFGLSKTADAPPKTRDFDLFRIPFIGHLRDVGVTSGVTLLFDRGDVDVLRGREHHSVVGNFIEKERCFLAATEPRLEHEVRQGAMVAMLIDGPLREQDVRIFRIE